ncbi:MAG: 3-phosphoshikimate 1-carboxyvinyltransferase [Pirellulaceae bacterium]
MSVSSSSSSGDSQAVTVEIVPGEAVSGSIRPPGSKSLTNRALLCAAMAEGTSVLAGALHSDDTEAMIEGLRQIGVEIQEDLQAHTLTVHGVAGKPLIPAADIDVGNSGTTIRFLTAVLSAAGGRYRLHGVERMHQRPIGDLIKAIEGVLEGHAIAETDGSCPPVSIESKGWRAGEIRVAGSISSQYLSGLLMAAPLAEGPIAIHVEEELVSKPYVEMTCRVMREFGVPVEWDEDALSEFSINAPLPYQPAEYVIEPDASAASYFWAAAAITAGTVTVKGLTRDSLQGDVEFVDVLQRMGCTVSQETEGITVTGSELKGIDVDMNGLSDTVQTLAAVALFADGATTIRGVAHNRFKETDRIADLARELRKLKADVSETADGLIIEPPPRSVWDALQGTVIETYDDHRMAMSLALVGLKIPGLQIANPACTAKTYPEFFYDLERLIARPHRWRSA